MRADAGAAAVEHALGQAIRIDLLDVAEDQTNATLTLWTSHRSAAIISTDRPLRYRGMPSP
jgi:hypothetical protein